MYLHVELAQLTLDESQRISLLWLSLSRMPLKYDADAGRSPIAAMALGSAAAA